MTDPDPKALIEKQIISTAHRYLGNFRSKILLSLPPEKESVPSEFGRVPQVPLFDNVLNESAFVFLEDVMSFSDDSVRERYKRLGLSAGARNRLKEPLPFECYTTSWS